VKRDWGELRQLRLFVDGGSAKLRDIKVCPPCVQEMNPAVAAGEEVYSAFREAADWDELLLPGQSFSIDAHVWSCTHLTSSQLLGVRGRDAICDAVRDRRWV
jgi:hypothetical protein